MVLKMYRLTKADKFSAPCNTSMAIQLKIVDKIRFGPK